MALSFPEYIFQTNTFNKPSIRIVSIDYNSIFLQVMSMFSKARISISFYLLSNLPESTVTMIRIPFELVLVQNSIDNN